MASSSENLFGNAVRTRREARGLTGLDMRRLTGINPTSLSFIERGQQEPSAEQIRRLASALGLKVDRLAVLAARTQFRRRSAGAA